MSEKKISRDWVTVADTLQAQEAYMLKSILEEEGIPVFLKDELTSMSYTNAMGGMKVQVPDTEAERACELLREAGILS